MPLSEKKSDRPMPANRVAGQARGTAEAVVTILARCLGEKRPADRCLRDYCAQNHQLGSRDRRIISETLFSVLRWWGWLQKLAPEKFTAMWRAGESALPIHASDWSGVLAACWILENRFELPPSVMFWLRDAGLYPELFQDIPADTTVADRRKYLRPFFQNRPMPPLVLEELLPEWVPAELAPEESVDYRKLVEWLQKRPPVWIRAQCPDKEYLRSQIAEESDGAIKLLPHERMTNAFCIRHAGANLRALTAFQAGAFEIQDLASQAVGIVCDPRPGQQWWDTCAGGGGKTLQLADLLQNRGIVEATDLRAFKLDELKLRARRGHFGNIRLREWQGNDTPPQFRGRFDGVLVDTACSCGGTWRRTPDGRWNTTKESLEEFTALQTKLLNAAADGCRPGGTLVYSTCSMFRRENQGVVEAFLDAHPEFILAPHEDPVTGKRSDGMTQHWPWDGDCDAMFTAKMIRRKN